ncbi:DUF4832 domain-containing protein [Sphingobacterium faecale]|uniref:DUF4832 domain-containing protein n=1 Tax=Sphingobacterium faecale TaxID=2803775 RepID=A0ABS1R204_9SPHI|nr:DUF4832 domain-containing protein [Sphingobacterium faecale]MBL1408739.1 DUF4832 domain-containing protein [Sphingobacterium faecale]
MGTLLFVTAHIYGENDKALCDSTLQYYTGSDEIFGNPERGLIHTYSTLRDNNKLSIQQLELLRHENVTTILRIIYLNDFRASKINKAKLKSIADDFRLIRRQGLKVIVRFAYTDDIEGEDAPLAVVLRHIDQLSPLLESNEDIIPFVQAGFIGAWGEWHSSSNNLTTLENQRAILFKLLTALPESIMVQVRTPAIKKRIFQSDSSTIDNILQQSVSSDRVGHHNDCFLSNSTDYGTYSLENISAEKFFIHQEGLSVPVGGETCPPTDGFDPDCQQSQHQLEYLRWTYLNLDWFGPTLDGWRESGCFEPISRRLGYRFRLISSHIPASLHQGHNHSISLQFFNDGYAPIYHKKIVKLILQNRLSSDIHMIPLDIDLRACKPGQYLNWEGNICLKTIKTGAYNIFISIADASDSLKDNKAYNLQLANKNIWREDKGWNDLQYILKIEY